MKLRNDHDLFCFSWFWASKFWSFWSGKVGRSLGYTCGWLKTKAKLQLTPGPRWNQLLPVVSNGNLLNSADVFHGNPGKPYSVNRKILFEGVRLVLFSCFYVGDSFFVGRSCCLYPHDSQCWLDIYGCHHPHVVRHTSPIIFMVWKGAYIKCQYPDIKNIPYLSVVISYCQPL